MYYNAVAASIRIGKIIWTSWVRARVGIRLLDWVPNYKIKNQA